MSNASNSDDEKSTEQPNNDLSGAMEQLSVTSDKTLILRKVSKSLRALVDKQKPALTNLKVSCRLGFIICNYNDHYVSYVSPHWIFSDSRSFATGYHFDTVITKDDYEQVAFDDLVSTLKNPKLQLKEFSFASEEEKFGVYDEYNAEFHDKLKTMQNILKSIDHQLSVKEIGIDIKNAMSILPSLKPGVLEKITILGDSHGSGYSIEAMQKVALLEQWKQATELELKGGFPDFLEKYVTHFKRFQFFERHMDYGILANVRDYVAKHENLEFCLISFEYPSIFDLFGVPIPSHHTIPDSDYYVEIMFCTGHVIIEKKKK